MFVYVLEMAGWGDTTSFSSLMEVFEDPDIAKEYARIHSKRYFRKEHLEWEVHGKLETADIHTGRYYRLTRMQVRTTV